VPVEDPQWQALDPPQRRQQTLDVLKRLLLREAQIQPLLVVFEDLHWIDSETQAFLNSLVESLPTARMSRLLTASLPPRKVVRSAVVRVRVRVVRVRVDTDEGPVEALKPLMAPEALKPPMVPEPFVAASELMPAPVPAIPG
jgi:hypothetical protein